MRHSLAALTILILSSASATGAPISPPFKTSQDAAEVILRLTFAGGMSMTVESYALYGDGRLERVFTDPAYPADRSEVQLSQEQVHHLLAPAVASGLATSDQRTLTDKMERGYAVDPHRQLGTPPIPPPPQDAATADLEIRLIAYGSPARPITNRLRVEGIEGVAQALPQVPELQAWSQLVENLQLFFTKRSEK